MNQHKLKFVLASCALVLGFQTSLMGQIFFTESFDYADGDLSIVSGGLWVGHSGGAPDIQVVSGDAIVTSPGSMDDNRLTGSIMDPTDVWYYAVRFSVELGSGQNINNDHFIHFKDSGTFNFNARLALDDPADPLNDFSLSIWASSEGDGQADWNGDFAFGEEIIAVVEWNNGTGDATLWVNPIDINSTSITDNELADAMRAVESVALRQDSGSSSVVTIPVLSVGTDFDAVLAAVTPATGPNCPTGFTLVAGIEQAGTDFANSCDADDVWWGLQSTTFVAAFTPPPIDVELDGAIPIDGGGANLTFCFEGHPTLGDGTAFITVALFNYTTGQFEQSVFSAQPNGPPDALYCKTVDNSSGDYVDGEGNVKARITCAKTTPGPVRLFIDSMYWEEN